jgi:hypothetical protein
MDDLSVSISYQVLGEYLGRSRRTAIRLVDELITAGYLQKQETRSRYSGGYGYAENIFIVTLPQEAVEQIDSVYRDRTKPSFTYSSYTPSDESITAQQLLKEELSYNTANTSIHESFQKRETSHQLSSHLNYSPTIKLTLSPCKMKTLEEAITVNRNDILNETFEQHEQCSEKTKLTSTIPVISESDTNNSVSVFTGQYTQKNVSLATEKTNKHCKDTKSTQENLPPPSDKDDTRVVSSLSPPNIRNNIKENKENNEEPVVYFSFKKEKEQQEPLLNQLKQAISASTPSLNIKQEGGNASLAKEIAVTEAHVDNDLLKTELEALEKQSKIRKLNIHEICKKNTLVAQLKKLEARNQQASSVIHQTISTENPPIRLKVEDRGGESGYPVENLTDLHKETLESLLVKKELLEISRREESNKLAKLSMNKTATQQERYNQLQVFHHIDNQLIDLKNKIKNLELAAKKITLDSQRVACLNNPTYIAAMPGDRALSKSQLERLERELTALNYQGNSYATLFNEIVCEVRFGSLTVKKDKSGELPIAHAVSVAIKLVREGRWSTPAVLNAMLDN